MIGGRPRLAIVAAAAVTLLGCAPDGPVLAPVSGVVTLDGEPLAGAAIEFQLDSPTGSPSYGETGPDGRYELLFTQDRRGALLGEHIVRITTENENRNARERVPARYNFDSELRCEVVIDRRGPVDFDLTTDEPTGP